VKKIDIYQLLTQKTIIMNLSLKKHSLFVFVLFLSGLLVAQQDSLQQLLPVDPKVRIGKLENGFNYYIRANHKPEKRVEMRLVVNAGSILEDEDQLGLAHFVEHMAFNGTAHFEKNELKNYLERIGIRFGPDLNAYTSFDETIYMLTIPSDSSELLEKGFLVMEDWAHAITFEDEEIDKERGVIIEEWRLGRGYAQRMRDKYLPVVFKNSRYAERLPIGKKEIVENCSYETLKRFYHDWYRPDLMALVIVGDIDPDFAENKIKEHFNRLQMPPVVREREYYPVPDHDSTLVCTVSDREAPLSMLFILYKKDVDPQKTYADYLQILRYSFITGMLNQRLSELAELENPPFIGAGFFYGGLSSRAKNALQGYAYVGEKGIRRGLQTVLVEAKRVDQFGFTPGEFNRFKLDLLKQYEIAYNEREKTESRKWADEYMSNYLEEEAIPGIEFEYKFVKENLDRITLDEINHLAQVLIKSDNRVIILGAPESVETELPTVEEVYACLDSIESSMINAYTDKLVSNRLMEEKPKPGKIKKQTKLAEIGATELRLSNGIRIILKPTNFKNDEVLLSAYSMGGHSVYPDSDHFTGLNADGIIQESGVDTFSNSDLAKILAGKSVYVAPSISYETEQISAQSKTSDLETMFQLIYLYFTDPRVDESSFNSYITKKKDLFENLRKEPLNYFFDQYHRIKAQNHPRGDYLPEPEDWDKINFQRAIEIYRDRFADAGDFTFIMVGAFDVEKVKPLIEQYIASLPDIKRDENYVDLGIRPPYNKTVQNIYKGNDPKSLAILYFEKEKPWNPYDAFMIGVLGDILRVKYVDILREEMSGIYTVRVNATMQKIPYSCASLQIMIPCAPENVDSLIHVAIGVLKKIQTSGVEENDIVKAKESRRRALEVNLESNSYWLKAIQDALMYENNLQDVTKADFIEKISSEEIQRVARDYFDSDRYLQVVLYPENYSDME
jgi:zinc protease